MSTAIPPSAPTTNPDPARAAPTMPAALGRVLSLVRKLIDYGRQLAGTVQQRAAAPGFVLFARPFGTADLAVILARIADGLRRATALEARLCQRAARGRDLTPSPVREPAACGPRPARQVAPPDAQPNPSPPTTPRTRASPACPRKRKSPPRCVAARSAPSSPISAATSASRPASSTGHSGTNSATPSSPMAAASPASSGTLTSGCSPPTTTPTARTPDGPRHLHDRQHPPPVRPERRPGTPNGSSTIPRSLDAPRGMATPHRRASAKFSTCRLRMQAGRG